MTRKTWNLAIGIVLVVGVIWLWAGRVPDRRSLRSAETVCRLRRRWATRRPTSS